VHAEADQPDDRQSHQAQRRAHGDAQALARPGSAEQHEGQREPRGELHPDGAHERGRRGSHVAVDARAQRERKRQRQQDQRVVVRAAERQHEQHGVQPDEGGRPARRVTEPGGRARDEGHGAEAGGDREGFEEPQRAGHAERGGRVARKREQRAIGGVLEGPADERVDRVAARFGRDVRVRVEPVQGAHAGEGHVPEHILRDQRRAQQQRQVRQHDAGDERPRRQRPHREQHERVARAHDQNQRLKAAFGQGFTEICKRAGQPPGPSADARGHVFRGVGRGVGAQQEGRAQHPEQAERAERPQDARRRPRGSGPAARFGRAWSDPGARYRAGGLHGVHCCV
jgi:hypothetical protein